MSTQKRHLLGQRTSLPSCFKEDERWATIEKVAAFLQTMPLLTLDSVGEFTVRSSDHLFVNNLAATHDRDTARLA